ncbi:MAG: ATP-dependent Clp protease proteolytic subunit [Oscillospiraceae bacterium]|nr:ATP-dependent Clp protease proteolytic subunit [Oscillospiraceae bacterium]
MDENALGAIVELGGSRASNSRGTIECLTVIGQVEGHILLPEAAKTTKYEHVMPLLAAVEQSDEVDALLILLNTVGGDIEAGMGIAELIAGMSKPTASLVLGGGHSIGVPLAVAADRSFIAPSADMTLHPVRMSGVVIGAPQTYSYLEKIQERIVSFITANSRIARAELTALMLKTGELAADVGSVIYGEEAVRAGLIDEVGGLADALENLYGAIDGKKRGR